ncbi:MAG: short-chain dehydrogenase [Phycisphaerae bacterium]|nr:short-chain dehydrogenase [Phycisphaerae bacterium]HCT43804.1 short-chain dehydrogenase [Phycisphaerales bacterium]|tara:strand:+ start:249 stop:764 length:516 start_codon:yes stop_codon:yes gene_type:complete
MADVLCIGATGMLAGCVRGLIARGDRVTALARSQSSLSALSESVPAADRDRLRTHPCDYRDLEALAHALRSIPVHPSAAICWVHTPAEPVLELVRALFPDIDLLRVVGSSTEVPRGDGARFDRIVRLGFVIEGDRSRWLSNEEISNGVVSALLSGQPSTTVGTVTPWDAHP